MTDCDDDGVLRAPARFRNGQSCVCR